MRSAAIRAHSAPDYDLAVVGAGFAGLACARSAALRGLSVHVLERQARAGQVIHTTGLLVKEAAERWEVPARLTQRVRGSAALRAIAVAHRSRRPGVLLSGDEHGGADEMRCSAALRLVASSIYFHHRGDGALSAARSSEEDALRRPAE